MIIDPRLNDLATPKQKIWLAAVNEHGGFRAATRALGLPPNDDRIRKSLRSLQVKGAREGIAPGHFDGGVAPGYAMGKVTVQRANGVIERTWERMSPDLEMQLEAIKGAVEALKEEIPVAVPFKGPTLVREDLLTQYTVTDYHFGMQAHASESDGIGASWNLQIAEDMLVSAMSHLAERSPSSGTAVLALMGDLMHFDGPDPVTPTHRHPLDAAARQRTMVRVVVRAIRRVVALLLAKHARVKIVVVEGNHDISGTPWLQEVLLTHYEDHPRVEVSDNDLPFYAMQFGVNLLGFHHGHKKQKASLPALFAQMFRKIWGATTKGYIHCGHMHHADEKEYPGTMVIQHRTLAAPDSHALRGGWLSEREMSSFHYHIEFGSIGRDSVTPEMLEAA